MNTFEEMLDKLASTANENIKREPDDYEVDGLLFCGKCHTQKQVRIEAFGREWAPLCMCKCAVEAEEEENRQRRMQERQAQIERKRADAFMDTRLIQATFDGSVDADPKAQQVAQRYVENFKEVAENGRGLLFFGGVGTGKTYLAACIVNALVDKGYSCLMTTFGKAVKQELDVTGFDLVVFDDFAAERDTEYMNEQVLSILDELVKSKKAIILTTNLTADELKNPPDITRKRLYSRIYEACFPVEVKGKDRRRAQLGDDYKKFKNLLGL